MAVSQIVVDRVIKARLLPKRQEMESALLVIETDVGKVIYAVAVWRADLTNPPYERLERETFYSSGDLPGGGSEMIQQYHY